MCNTNFRRLSLIENSGTNLENIFLGETDAILAVTPGARDTFGGRQLARAWSSGHTYNNIFIHVFTSHILTWSEEVLFQFSQFMKEAKKFMRKCVCQWILSVFLSCTFSYSISHHGLTAHIQQSRRANGSRKAHSNPLCSLADGKTTQYIFTQ